MEIPDFFHLVIKGITRETHYIRLKKALYGLKQAPRAWFEIVKQFFQKIRLTGGHADPNLFIGNRVYILLFIDDIIIIGKMDKIQQVKAKIAKE